MPERFDSPISCPCVGNQRPWFVQTCLCDWAYKRSHSIYSIYLAYHSIVSRFPPSFIHLVIIITGLNKLYMTVWSSPEDGLICLQGAGIFFIGGQRGQCPPWILTTKKGPKFVPKKSKVSLILIKISLGRKTSTQTQNSLDQNVPLGMSSILGYSCHNLFTFYFLNPDTVNALLVKYFRLCDFSKIPVNISLNMKYFQLTRFI